MTSTDGSSRRCCRTFYSGLCMFQTQGLFLLCPPPLPCCPGGTAGISSQHPGGEETQESPLGSKSIRAGRIRGNVAGVSGFHSRRPDPSPRDCAAESLFCFSLTAPPAPGIQFHVLNTARAPPIRAVLKVCSARTKMAKAPLLASKALPQLPPHTFPPWPTAL